MPRPETALWPLALYFGCVLAVAALMIGLSYVLGERHRETATDLPYESGVASLGSARLRLSAQFYLVALLFVIFDLEAVFIFAWSVAMFDLGWPGYLEISIFIAVLLAALLYLWRLRALDWARGPLERTIDAG